ncbi:polysaccharide deacetylase family protein [Prochlorococcus marinus]|uniref:polysaccharide deacetylase family protein n=1 Tax=Prochlorococcus marinus TaxID=1219 RepID=UPI0022B5CB5D|nr:polysaccharide deacetylase family protein [Prochlorococcus marinus]
MAQLKLRKYFSMICNKIGLAPRLLSDYSKRLVAIDYHYFTNKDVEYDGLEVNYKNLINQLEIINRNCKLRSPIDSLNDLFNGKLQSNKQNLIVTIDDADISILNALPIFEEYNIPLILFAPVGLCLPQNDSDGLRSRCLHMYKYVNKTDINLHYPNLISSKEYFDYIVNSNFRDLDRFYSLIKSIRSEKTIILERKLMSLEQLKKIIDNNNFIVASHTMSHSVLSELPAEWMEWEISRASSIIQQLGGDTRFFAYPYGYKSSYNKDVKDVLKKYGVKYAFTTTSSLSKKESDPLSIGRASMLDFNEKSFVLGTVSGAFRLWDKLLMR